MWISHIVNFLWMLHSDYVLCICQLGKQIRSSQDHILSTFRLSRFQWLHPLQVNYIHWFSIFELAHVACVHHVSYLMCLQVTIWFQFFGRKFAIRSRSRVSCKLVSWFFIFIYKDKLSLLFSIYEMFLTHFEWW